MKRYVNHTDCFDEIFCMSKLSKKYANKSLTGEFGDSVYFSPSQHGCGPRIKFYAGETSKNTRDYPYIPFSQDSTGAPVGDVKLNPLLKDDNLISNVMSFVDRFKPLLLLVWYEYLDEEDLLQYFNGAISFETIVSELDLPSDCDTCSSGNVNELDEYCRRNNLYNFKNRRTVTVKPGYGKSKKKVR